VVTLTLQLLYPRKYPVLATEQSDGWVSEPGCTLEKRKTSFSSGNLVFIYLFTNRSSYEG